MPTNDFLPVAEAGGANVQSQVAYAANPNRTDGFPTGYIPKAIEHNKMFRQAAAIASVVAQAICDITGDDMLDDGDDAGHLASFKEMLTAAVRLLANGTVGAPSLAFANALTTGLYLAASNTLGLVANGVEFMRSSSTLITTNILMLCKGSYNQTYEGTPGAGVFVNVAQLQEAQYGAGYISWATDAGGASSATCIWSHDNDGKVRVIRQDLNNTGGGATLTFQKGGASDQYLQVSTTSVNAIRVITTRISSWN